MTLNVFASVVDLVTDKVLAFLLYVTCNVFASRYEHNVFANVVDLVTDKVLDILLYMLLAMCLHIVALVNTNVLLM